MSCREGFDPFGDRHADLLAHAEHCPECGDVLRVLGSCTSAWKRGVADDRGRAFFRERRLGRARPPARTAMTTLVFAVVLAGLSGFALAGHAGPRVAPPEKRPPRVAEPRPAPPEVAPRRATNEAPSPEPTVEPSAEPAPDEAPIAVPSVARSVAPVETSRELWQRAVALLDAGDRAEAERAFGRVMDLPHAEPGLRSRATFRWAQLLMSRGDTRTPREPLFRLVRSADAALAFDAAVLLERCAPDERARIWDTYLARTTDPALRARALEHQ